MKPYDFINKYRIRPQKRLGQHFLIDMNIRDKLCTALGNCREDIVVEIGAGAGALTEKIAPNCGRLYAIEADRKLCDILNKEISARYRTVVVLPQSILRVDIAALAGKGKVKIIGNVPYYLTAKILFYLVDYCAHISSAVLTVQKEVAERLLALPGSKTYGRLTVSMRLFADVVKLFEIKPTSFFPSPQVTSVVLRLTFRTHIPSDIDQLLLVKIIKVLFQERRKKVHNNLRLLKAPRLTKEAVANILTACDISSNARAEELMMKDFLALAREIKTRCA